MFHNIETFVLCQTHCSLPLSRPGTHCASLCTLTLIPLALFLWLSRDKVIFMLQPNLCNSINENMHFNGENHALIHQVEKNSVSLTLFHTAFRLLLPLLFDHHYMPSGVWNPKYGRTTGCIQLRPSATKVSFEDKSITRFTSFILLVWHLLLSAFVLPSDLIYFLSL